MKTLGIIKRGDSFSFTAALTDNATGEALTGAAARLRCQGRYEEDDSTVVAELTVSETSTAGTYLFAADDGTVNWRPDCRIYFDIEYTAEDGTISSTETFYVTIDRDVTQPAEE